jgi:hypothetical protein
MSFKIRLLVTFPKTDKVAWFTPQKGGNKKSPILERMGLCIMPAIT